MVVHLASAVGFDGDVNIIEIAGNAIAGANLPVTIAAQSLSPIVVGDGGGSITIDGTVTANQGGAWSVTIQEPLSVDDGGLTLSVDDGGGSITVDGTVAVSGTVNVDVVAQTVGNITVDIAAQALSPIVVGDGGGTLSIDDGAGSITVDGTVAATQSGAWSVTVLGQPIGVSIDAQTADVEVVQATRGDLNANATVQVAGSDASSSNRVPIEVFDSAGVSFGSQANPLRITEVGPGSNRPNFYLTLGGFDLPSTIMLDPLSLLASSAAASSIGNQIRVGPGRQAITQIFTAQVFNDVTTSANSSSYNCQECRHLVVYIDLSESGNATDIRLIAQFDRGGGNWFRWLIDQWVDLRYVVAQMSLLEVLPLNHVPGRTFRLRAIATGTTATDTITLSAWVEGIS